MNTLLRLIAIKRLTCKSNYGVLSIRQCYCRLKTLGKGNKLICLPTLHINRTDTIMQTNSNKLPHIDSLRGIAILMVIVCHVSQSQVSLDPVPRVIFDFGKMGVQLFFFLSAYTLCLSMDNRKEHWSIRNFYIRRYFRIAPLYYIGIAIYYIVSKSPYCNQFIIVSDNESYTTSNIISNILLVHGLIPSANNSIVPGGWSIGTEVLFYLVFPLMFILYTKLNPKARHLFPLYGLIVAILFSLIVYSLDRNGLANPFYYYNILNQLQIFLFGMSYYFLEKYNLKPFSAVKSFLFFIVLFSLSFLVSVKFKHINGCLSVFLAGLAFVFLFKFLKENNYHLKPLQRIGELSFSIYILHFLFAYPLVTHFVHSYDNKSNPYILFGFSIIIVIALSTSLAVLTEKLIERPGIKLGKKLIMAVDRFSLRANKY